MPSRTEDRRTAIADTVIEVLASQGARGLTHRAVDTAADLPPGSTSYYFRTREALLIAAAGRLADLDLAAGGHATPPRTIDELAEMLARLVYAQANLYRDRTLARYHLSLEAARYPAVSAVLDELGTRFTLAAVALLTAVGADDPHRDARALVAVCAGIVYESTVGGQRPFTRAETKAVLLDLLRARTASDTAT
ncbi:TetR family transcriptional regulator [Jatrophihabitans sp. DSM 45814]